MEVVGVTFIFWLLFFYVFNVNIVFCWRTFIRCSLQLFLFKNFWLIFLHDSEHNFFASTLHNSSFTKRFPSHQWHGIEICYEMGTSLWIFCNCTRWLNKFRLFICFIKLWFSLSVFPHHPAQLSALIFNDIMNVCIARGLIVSFVLIKESKSADLLDKGKFGSFILGNAVSVVKN